MIDSYTELPLGKYQEIVSISKDETLGEIDRQVAILSVLSDIDEQSLLTMPILEYRELAKRMQFLQAETLDVKAGTVGKAYRIGGMEFVPTLDIKSMTTAQYIDFQHLSRMPEADLVALVSCFLVPKGHKYNEGYDMAESQACIRDNLSVVEADRLIAFFLTRFSNSIRGMLICSRYRARRIRDKGTRARMMAEIRKAERLLAQSGGGLQTWMRLRRP